MPASKKGGPADYRLAVRNDRVLERKVEKRSPGGKLAARLDRFEVGVRNVVTMEEAGAERPATIAAHEEIEARLYQWSLANFGQLILDRSAPIRQ